MNSDLSRLPHGPRSKLWWWYEESYGISVIVDGSVAPGGHEVMRIPWRIIRRALARKDRKERKASHA